MRTFCFALLLSLWMFACGTDSEGPGPDEIQGRMLIVAADSLTEAAEAYRDFREETGFDVEFATSGELDAVRGGSSLESALHDRIVRFVEAAQEGDRSFVLLIGKPDVREPDNPLWLPLGHGPRGEEGDGPLADLDGDMIPEVPIGRLPMTEPAQVEAYLARIQVHEASYKPGPWNKRMSVFAGEGGFGPEIDAALELAAIWIFESLPPDFDYRMTYAADSSDYYLPPEAWDAEYAKAYSEGSLMQPYIGHTKGSAACCEQQRPPRRGMVTFFACSDGIYQYGDSSISLAEDLLLREQGPVATLAGSDLTHPYANAVLPRELGRALLESQLPTYGEAYAQAQWDMIHNQDSLRNTLEEAAAPFLDQAPDDILNEHLVLYNFFGDPAAATKLPPGRLRFDLSHDRLSPGGTLTVSGKAWQDLSETLMESGRVNISLQTKLNTIPGELLPRESSNHDEEICISNHAVANDKILVRTEVDLIDGQFSAELTLPADATTGEIYVKLFAWDDESDAVGAELLRVVQ
ncbi:MAG: hypothetical protein JRF33_09625 [Deltaproteobacteria bacterium]|nr:hypothetical protein [Deltaproteobacteria bacterium]